MTISQQPYRVVVVIPVYNEVNNIERVIAEIKALPIVPEYTLEAVVVDGGSSDGSQEVARIAGAKVVPQRQRGYGAACYTGYEQAQIEDIVLFMDGDYSDPPNAIPQLLTALINQKADLVLGSRTLGKAEPGALLLHQAWGNFLVTSLIGLLYRHHLSDLPSLKAIWAEKLTALHLQEMTYGFTVEMLVKSLRANYKVVEVPISYRKRGDGKSKVSGTLNGTIKAAYYLINTALRYKNWRPDALETALRTSADKLS